MLPPYPPDSYTGISQSNSPQLYAIVSLMDILETVKARMLAYDKGAVKRNQHLLKVHSLSRLIGMGEGLSGHDLFVLETAALLHDIGIKPSLEKYGSSAGKYQEAEGPGPATELLQSLGYAEEDIGRVCKMIAHHHTYTGIDTLELQILIEADFIVNLYEDGESLETVRNVERNIFRTKTGKQVLEDMFFA